MVYFVDTKKEERCEKTGNWKRNNRPIKDWYEQTKANTEMIKYRVPLCPETG